MSEPKGYLFPDPVDPGEMICVRVYIPNHMLYIAAFWGAYGFFTTWVAWMRDPLKKGKQVAEVWKRAYEKARAEFERTKGVCYDMITGLRTKPLNKCVLQAEIDGEWVDIFDAECCGGSSGCGGGSLRYNGTTIQRYDTDSGEWVDAGPPVIPTELPTSEPPWEPAGNGSCVAATNFGQLIQARKNKMANAVGDLLSFGDWILTAMDFPLQFYPGLGTLLSVIGTVLAQIYNGMQDIYADVAAVDIEDEAVCIANTHYRADGSMPQSEVDEMLQDINAKIAEFEPTEPEAFAWRYVYGWVKAAGVEGMMVAGYYEGITEGTCEGCEWNYFMDFTKETGGFVKGNYDEDPAFYNAGYYTAAGWKTQVMPHAGGDVPVIALERTCAPTTIKEVQVTYVAVMDGLPGDITDGITVQYDASNHALEEGEHTYVYQWLTGLDSETMSIKVRLRNAGTGYPDASVVIKSIKWIGTGTNPFIAPLPPVGA